MNEQKKQAVWEMLYLCGYVITAQKPCTPRPIHSDLRSLYTVSQYHSLAAIVYEGLQMLNFEPTDEDYPYMASFRDAAEKSVRKNLLLDTERAQLFSFFEQSGIWYMPLKGVLLKDLYPKMGLRQMSDNDILFDEYGRQAVRDWFVNRGYEVSVYGLSSTDVYQKKPVYNFEMHTRLFGENEDPAWQAYYRDIKDRLIPTPENAYAYRFTDEDFYIYFITHAYKHYDGSGHGIRFLLDLYLYITSKESTLNFFAVDRELHALGLSDFEQNCRALAIDIFANIHTFDPEKLSPERKTMLQWFLSSGTYGTMEQRVQKGIEKKGRFAYLMKRLFPGPKALKDYHPMFRHAWLMPVGWLYRAFKILTTRASKSLRELATILRK